MSDILSISLSVHPVFLPVSPYGSHAGLIFLPHFFPQKVIQWFIKSAESSKATNHEGLVVALFKRGEQSAAVINGEMPLKEALVAALPSF